MIVWHGRGITVAIATFACLLTSEVLSEKYFHDDTYYQRQGWPKLAGFLVAASLVWWLKRDSGSEVIPSFDRQVRKEPILRSNDSLFFIPVRYWPAILCALGMIFYFVRE